MTKTLATSARFSGRDSEMLHDILEQIEALGIGADVPVNGGDAVDFLNDLHESLRAYLRVPL
jgi:hypothetical protein